MVTWIANVSLGRFGPILPSLLLTLFAATGALCADVQATAGLSLIAAVRSTLVMSPELMIQRESVQLARGAQQEQSGRFDLVPTAGLSAQQEYADQIRTRNSGFNAAMTQNMRGGQRYGLAANVVRLSDVINNPNSPNTGTVRLFFDQPLLRGRGRSVAQADERAASIAVNAEQYELRGTIADHVTETTRAYWDYRAAFQRMNIFVAREQRTEQRQADIELLIEKGEQPRASAALVAADLAEQRAQRTITEAELYNKRQALGVAIGIPFEEIDQLPLPTDPFPDIDYLSIPSSPVSDVQSNPVWNQRPEFLAAAERLRSARVVFQATVENTQPALTLSMNAGYSAVDNGTSFGNFLSPLFDSPPGMNAGMGLAYEFPVGNNTRRGRAAQARALYRQHQINIGNLKRTILSDVSVASNSLRASAQSHLQRVQASDQYRQVLHNVMRKYQLGAATLLDIIQVENEYTESLIDQVDTALDMAKAIVELRRATGTIVSATGNQVDLQRETLTTISSTPVQ